MNIKEFTESAIAIYLEKGGTVHPDITLDIFQALREPLATMTIGGAGGRHRQEVGRALLVDLEVMEEGFPQVGILDHAPRTHNAGDIKRLARSTHHHAHGARIVAHGQERCVTMSCQGQVSMDLVAEHHHAIFPGQSRYLAQHISLPCDADGVVWIAQDHHGRMIPLEDALQALEIHLVKTIGGA